MDERPEVCQEALSSLSLTAEELLQAQLAADSSHPAVGKTPSVLLMTGCASQMRAATAETATTASPTCENQTAGWGQCSA